MATKLPLRAGRIEVGRITVVAVSKLRVGNEVGNGVLVGTGVLVGVAEAVGVNEPAGVHVIKTTLSAPWYVGVIVGDCPSRGKRVAKTPHRQRRKNSPTPPRINFPLSFC